MKEMLSYSGWYLFGTLATVVRSQGINILLNLFFNPVVNAARAIAFQINNALNQFVNSFYNAVRPQITKLTAAEEKEKMQSLVFSSSIISVLLMDLIAVPLIVEMPIVLSMWLGEIPEHTVIFGRLVIITAIIDTLGYPLTTAVCATGNIRNFQVVTGVILMLNLPVSYFLLQVWHFPALVFYVSILFAAIAQVVRIEFMKRMFGMSIIRYAKDVLWRTGITTVMAILVTYFIDGVLGHAAFAVLTTVFISLLAVSFLSWIIGMNKTQRAFVLGIIRKIF